MAGDDNRADTPSAHPRPRGPATRLAALLTSVPFAAIVVAAIAVACMIGTILPQGSEVAEYLKHKPEARRTVEFLGLLGLTRVYSSPWFIALLGLLSASLTACTYRRLRVAIDKTGRSRGRAVGSVITHISLLLVLAGGVVRGLWGERGYLPLREGETKNVFFVGDDPKELPFSIRLVRFDIETYGSGDEQDRQPRIVRDRILAQWHATDARWDLSAEPGIEHTVAPSGQPPEHAVRVRILRRLPDFAIDMTTREVSSRSDQPRNPAVLVETSHHGQTNSQWLFALHPDFDMHDADAARVLDLRYVVELSSPPGGTIKDYKSTLQVLEGSEVLVEKTIEVNSPLSHAGYTFYQSGFNPEDLEWTSLQVVKDPGVPLVYTGFGLMIMGLAAVFYLYPQKRPGSGTGDGKET